MSSITTAQGILHYEVYGRGKPVILLHGWLGTWGLWQDVMASLGQSYRTYALDFWGFGDSGKRNSTFQVQDFILMVRQFMDQMGIASAPLIGHSMGGTVSLSYACQFPDRAEKVVIIGSPIVGTSLALALKLAGVPPIARMLFSSMGLFRMGMKAASPLISRGEDFPEMMDRDLSKTTMDSFFRSISSLHRWDIRQEIPQVKIPVMGMFGLRDIIVNPNQWKVLKQGIPNARIEIFKKAGHFIMLDEPEAFKEKIFDFLQEPVPLS